MDKAFVKKAVAAVGTGATALAATMIIGFENKSNTAYPDPATHGAPYTICVGHTGGVQPHQTATDDMCVGYLTQDVATAQNAVKRLVKVPLSDGEMAAYTSFVLNAGQGNFAGSTMLRKLNAKQRTEACEQLPRWVYGAGNVKLNGLVNRRRIEKNVCLMGVQGSPIEVIAKYVETMTGIAE